MSVQPVLTCAFRSVDLYADVCVFVPQDDSDDNEVFVTVLS